MIKSTNLKDPAFLTQQDIVSWKRSTENKQEETQALFSQLIPIFDDDSELPIEQLKSCPAQTITEYLTKSHFIYLNKRLPEIEQQLLQLSSTGELPETLSSVFAWLQKNMEKHFRIEEQSLFPYIVDLAKVNNNSLSKEELNSKYKDFSVNRFIEGHHDDIENKLAEIKKYIVRSLQSMEELFPYRVVLQKLDVLEKDLRIHAKIEDEVLVPMALEWEDKN